MESFRVKAAFLGGVAAAARRYAPQAASMLTRGLGGELQRQVGFGAGVGGLLEGGVAAANAEEGQKLKAFGSGALHGAAMGGAMGAATAPIATAGKNLRLEGLKRMGNHPRAAQAAYDRGYLGTVKDVVTGKGPAGRAGAAFEAAAAPAQFAAEMALPAMAMGAISPAPQPQLPPQQKQAASSTQPPMVAPETQTQEQRAGFQFEPAYISPFTSMAGKGMTDTLVEKLHPEMPHGFFRKRALPALGAAALTIPAVKAIRAMNPEPTPLDDIDVDALKYYFGKQPPG